MKVKHKNQWKYFVNKNVLSFVLNVATLSVFLAYSGVVFHNGGAAVENSRPPYVLDQLWLGCIIANGTTIVVLLVDDIPQSEVPEIQQIVHWRFYIW